MNSTLFFFMKFTSMNDNKDCLYEEEDFSSCNTSKVKLLNLKYQVCFVCFSGILEHSTNCFAAIISKYI